MRRTQIFLTICITLLIAIRGYPQNVSELQGLLTTLPEEKHDSIYYELTKATRSTDPELAKFYITKVYELSVKYNHSKFTENACYGLQYFLSKEGNLDSAMIFNKEGLKYAKLNNSFSRIIIFNNNIGLHYKTLQFYDSALSYSIASLNMAIDLESDVNQAIANNNIASIYLELQNYEAALSYLTAALESAEQMDDRPLLLATYVNLSISYIELQQYEQAIDILTKTLTLCESSECESTLYIKTLYNLGYCYLEQDVMDEASRYLMEVRTLSKDANDENMLASANSLLYSILVQTGKMDSSLSILQEAEAIVDRTNNKLLKRNIYQKMSEYYERVGDLERSLEYNKRFTAVKDSIFNETLAQNISDINIEAKQKEAQRIISQKDLEIKRSRTISILVGAVSSLSVIIIALLIRAYRQNKRIQNNLESEVEKRTEDLKIRNEDLAKSHKEYDHLIYRTSHDIRGPLSTLIGLTNLAKVEVQNGFSQDGMIDYLNNIEKTATGLTSTLSKFLIVDKVRNQKLLPQSLQVDEMITNIRDSFADMFHFNKVNFSLDIDENVRSWNSDRFMMEIIISRLLKNAYFFYDEEKDHPMVNVKVSQSDDKLVIKFIDNGIGIRETAVNKIFDLFFVASHKHGSGIGLFLVQTAIGRLNGNISIDRISDPTMITVEIPNLTEEEIEENDKSTIEKSDAYRASRLS